jgi:hypothetical protein
MPHHPVFDRPGFNNLGNAAWGKSPRWPRRWARFNSR